MSEEYDFPNGMCIRPRKWSRAKINRVKKFAKSRHAHKKVRKMIKRLKTRL